MGTTLSLLWFKLMPFICAFADSEVQTTNDTLNNVVGWAGGIGGGLVAIALIISIVKDGLEYAKGNGNGSVLKIVGKVLFLILMIGLIFLATNWQKIGNSAKGVGDTVVNQTNGQLDHALTGK